MDYVLLQGRVTGVFSIYDVSHNLIGTYSDTAASGTKNATFDWSGAGIAELDFSGPANFVGVSTLRFEESTVPEPASIALLGLGLAGLGFRRRSQT